MIESMHIFLTGFAKCSILCPDKTVVEIQIPAEALLGLNIHQRYEIITEKANNYIEANCK